MFVPGGVLIASRSRDIGPPYSRADRDLMHILNDDPT